MQNIHNDNNNNAVQQQVIFLSKNLVLTWLKWISMVRIPTFHSEIAIFKSLEKTDGSNYQYNQDLLTRPLEKLRCCCSHV